MWHSKAVMDEGVQKLSMNVRERFIMKKKSTLQMILETVICYILFFLLNNLVFSLTYCIFCPQLSFYESFFSSLMGKIYEETQNDTVGLISVVYDLLLTIAIAILTGRLFEILINKQPKVYLPKKLVIYRSHSDNVIRLGVTVGNPNKAFLNDVKCVISCYFAQIAYENTSSATQENINMNGKYRNTSSAAEVQNYYRFDFPILELPVEFLQGYAENSTLSKHNYILVTVSGTCDHLGVQRPFQIKKVYRTGDIIIGKSAARFSKTRRNPKTQKERRIILWSNVLNPAPENGDACMKIMQEIVAQFGGKWNDKKDTTDDPNAGSTEGQGEETDKEQEGALVP